MANNLSDMLKNQNEQLKKQPHGNSLFLNSLTEYIKTALKNDENLNPLNIQEKILYKAWEQHEEMPIVHKIHEWIKYPEIAQQELGVSATDQTWQTKLKRLRNDIITPCHRNPLACMKHNKRMLSISSDVFSDQAHITPIIGSDDRLFDSLFCYYDKNAEPHKVPTFDENLMNCNKPVQSRWHIACVRSPDDFKYFYHLGEQYWHNLILQNLDENGKIRKEVVEELAEQASEFMYEMDYMLERTGRVLQQNHNFVQKNSPKNDLTINFLAGLEKDMIGLKHVERFHQFPGIIKIAERQKELMAEQQNSKEEKIQAYKRQHQANLFNLLETTLQKEKAKTEQLQKPTTEQPKVQPKQEQPQVQVIKEEPQVQKPTTEQPKQEQQQVQPQQVQPKQAQPQVQEPAKKRKGLFNKIFDMTK